MNIVESILFQCKLNPLALAICVPGSKYGSVNYGTLERLIYNAARAALKTGIAPNTIVATYVNDKVLEAAITFGLMYLGVVSLSLREPKAVTGITTDIILTDVPGKVSVDATVLTVDQSWLEGEGTAPDTSPVDANDICRIILTSGSTGLPKGVALSYRTMMDRTLSYSTLRGPRFAHCSRFFCDLGFGSSPGLHYTLALLGRGATIYFLGQEPADILQTIDLHKIQGMGTSPYGLGEFLRFFEADSNFETSFDHIICQGAMLSGHLSWRARARLCQNIYSSFGATETSTVAFGSAVVIERVPGAVGYVQPGATINAVDQSGKVLPPLEDGAIRIRSRHMASGYVGDQEATEELFRDGYFYSGDIGHVTSDGLLVITGREKSALNIGGATVSPERVEEIITSFGGIRESGVFAVNNDLGIAELHALVVADAAIDEAGLRKYCAERLPTSCNLVRIIAVEALPRGGQGKPERNRFAELAKVQSV